MLNKLKKQNQSNFHIQNNQQFLLFQFLKNFKTQYNKIQKLLHVFFMIVYHLLKLQYFFSLLIKVQLNISIIFINQYLIFQVYLVQIQIKFIILNQFNVLKHQIYQQYYKIILQYIIYNLLFINIMIMLHVSYLNKFHLLINIFYQLF